MIKSWHMPSLGPVWANMYSDPLSTTTPATVGTGSLPKEARSQVAAGLSALGRAQYMGQEIHGTPNTWDKKKGQNSNETKRTNDRAATCSSAARDQHQAL